MGEDRTLLHDTTGVPFRIVDEAYVQAERYYDRDFFALERAKLWPFTWQAACRLEDVPEAGDFVEYEVAGRSILLVRQADGTVKAFENACRHRGTALGSDCGTFHGGQIVCPFHAWRFDLDGRCSYVYARDGFRPDTVDADRLRLVECQVAPRWGIAWINMDVDALPFEEVVSSTLPMLDFIGLDRARTNWWRSIRIAANWKIALEAFLESYHILQTHPELAAGVVGDAYDADAFSYTVDVEHGHGWIDDTTVLPIADVSAAAFMVLNSRVLYDGVEGWVTDEQFELMESLWRKVPGELTEDEFLQQFYEQVYTAGAVAGAPLPERPALGLAFIFPNTALINNLGNSMIYRFLPDPGDPEACTWEIWSVSPAAADAPMVRPVRQRLEEQRELPSVFAQDASNMELQQKGLRSGGFAASVYSSRYEPMIPNMHRGVDRFLAR